MSGKSASLVGRSLIAGLLTLSVSTGCRGLGQRIVGAMGASSAAPRVTPAPEKPVTVRRDDAPGSTTMLTAVEEFLEHNPQECAKRLIS